MLNGRTFHWIICWTGGFFALWKKKRKKEKKNWKSKTEIGQESSNVIMAIDIEFFFQRNVWLGSRKLMTATVTVTMSCTSTTSLVSHLPRNSIFIICGGFSIDVDSDVATVALISILTFLCDRFKAQYFCYFNWWLSCQPSFDWHQRHALNNFSWIAMDRNLCHVKYKYEFRWKHTAYTRAPFVENAINSRESSSNLNSQTDY